MTGGQDDDAVKIWENLFTLHTQSREVKGGKSPNTWYLSDV